MNGLQTLSTYENNGSEHAIEDSSEESEGEEEPTIFSRNSSTSSLGQPKSLLTALFNQNSSTKSTPALQRTASSLEISPQDTSISTADIFTESSEGSQPLSVRATRKNMILSEMTEDLRKSVQWERQSKRSTTQAVLRRIRTAHVDLEHYDWSLLGDYSTRTQAVTDYRSVDENKVQIARTFFLEKMSVETGRN